MLKINVYSITDKLLRENKWVKNYQEAHSFIEWWNKNHTTKANYFVIVK